VEGRYCETEFFTDIFTGLLTGPRWEILTEIGYVYICLPTRSPRRRQVLSPRRAAEPACIVFRVLNSEFSAKLPACRLLVVKRRGPAVYSPVLASHFFSPQKELSSSSLMIFTHCRFVGNLYFFTFGPDQLGIKKAPACSGRFKKSHRRSSTLPEQRLLSRSHGRRSERRQTDCTLPALNPFLTFFSREAGLI